jgi:hypothetical protein
MGRDCSLRPSGTWRRTFLAPSQLGQIHRGDDKASELPGWNFAWRRCKQAFKRSILFITFACEELDCLDYFVNHRILRLTAMIYTDMIGSDEQ